MAVGGGQHGDWAHSSSTVPWCRAALRLPYALVVLVLVLAIGLSGCFDEDPCGLSEGTLEATLDGIVDSERLDSISLSEVVPLDWDRVFFFGEYTAAHDILKATRLEYSADELGMFDHVPEHHILVVFTLEGESRCHELINIPGIDEEGWVFATDTFSRSGLARSDAVFRIERGDRIDRFQLKHSSSGSE